METQFGLTHVWSQGDWVTRTGALILLAMSLASWLVIAIKALDLRQHRAQARQCHAFWHTPHVDAGLQALQGDARTPLSNWRWQGATLHCIWHQPTQPPPPGRICMTGWT